MVFSVCSNKIPQTGWLANNRNLFLSSGDWEGQGQGTGIITFWWGPSSRLQTSCYICTWWKGWGDLDGASFIQALIPWSRALPSWSNHFPKVPPLNTIILGVRFSTHEFWGIHSDHSNQYVSLSRTFHNFFVYGKLVSRRIFHEDISLIIICLFM